MPRRVSIFLVPFLLTGCFPMLQNQPELSRFEGNKMTICCNDISGRGDCGQQFWVQTIQQHCTGTAKALSGEKEEKVVGKSISAETDENLNPYFNDKRTDVEVRDTTVTHQCIVYECSGQVLP
jgi:hypothetical protein